MNQYFDKSFLAERSESRKITLCFVLAAIGTAILFVFCGCSSPSINRIDVERMAKMLGENNATFTIRIEGKSIEVSRVNPLIGISSGVGTLWTHPPTNTQLQITQHQVSLAPEGPKIQTNHTNSVPVKQP